MTRTFLGGAVILDGTTWRTSAQPILSIERRAGLVRYTVENLETGTWVWGSGWVPSGSIEEESCRLVAESALRLVSI